MCLNCQTHINHVLRPCLLLAPASLGGVSSISVCEPVSLSSLGLLQAGSEEPALGKAEGEASKENRGRFCWWSGKKLKQVTGVLSDQWCPCSFPPSICERHCTWNQPQAEWQRCWGSSCANGHRAFCALSLGSSLGMPQFPAAPERALLYSWRGCSNLGQVRSREWMSGAQLLVKLPEGPWEIPFCCWIWAVWGSVHFAEVPAGQVSVLEPYRTQVGVETACVSLSQCSFPQIEYVHRNKGNAVCLLEMFLCG